MPRFGVGTAADPMMGKLVEGYRIVRVVGFGGMGVVYEAVHQEIEQRAAVKILLPEYSTDLQAVGRFLAEARAVAKVQHAGLVKLFHSGRMDDGTAYIMMEFLEGDSVEARLRRLSSEGRRMELATATRIAAQISSALSAVHAEGIVHRDMKPANVILVSDPEVDGGERIKVVDFGIAKVDTTTTEISKTTVGRFLGTALYASPEQCQMSGEVGPAADVYALGVMLYEMLAGRPPFVAEQPGLVIGMHLFVAPPPLYTHLPHVPEALHQLVHAMLAKDPRQRPSMAEIGPRLAELRTSRATLLQRIGRDRRLLIGLTGATLFLASGLGLGVVTLGRRLSTQPGAAPAVLASPGAAGKEPDSAADPVLPAAARLGPAAEDTAEVRVPPSKEEPHSMAASEAGSSSARRLSKRSRREKTVATLKREPPRPSDATGQAASSSASPAPLAAPANKPEAVSPASAPSRGRSPQETDPARPSTGHSRVSNPESSPRNSERADDGILR